MDKLISVVIPIYNVEKLIARCVDSVINQTYKNLEIILVDDGSPDACPEICDDYAKKDARVRVIHKQNGGLSSARNAGIAAATGEYITFIDSDDFVNPDYVQTLYTSICEDETSLAISSHRAVYDNGTVIDRSNNRRCTLSSQDALKCVLYDDGIDVSAWAKLYKLELFSDIKYPEGRLYEDAATTYKLIDKAGKVSLDSKVIYNYMIRSTSIAAGAFSPKKMDLITSTREMCDYIKNKYPELEKAANRRLVYAYLSTLSQLAQSKTAFPNEQKELMSFLKANGGSILKDKSVPSRDKLGLLAAKFGFGFYKFVWSLYCKASGRK